MRSGLRLYGAVIVLAGGLTYWNSLSGPFILDDQTSIVGNEQIRRLWPPPDVLFPARELSTAGRPVVSVSFALNYAFDGLEVDGYHVVNVAIHLCCALLLFGVVRRTLNLPSVVVSGFSRTLLPQSAGHSANLALASALIWMLHPLQTEAVNYVTQRTELLMACFGLLTLYAGMRAHESTLARGVRLDADHAFVRSVRLQPGRGWAGQWLAGGACPLGAGRKESMATVPVLIVLFDRIFVFESLKEAWRVRWRLYLGLAASWIVLAALMWSGPRSSSTGFSTGVSPWVYLLNQTVLIVRYLRLTFWPSSLVIDYGVPQPLTLADVMPYAALLVLLLLSTMVALKYRPKLGFLGAWFFITLAPASSVLPIATWVGAERRMYLPLAAVVVLFVAMSATVRGATTIRVVVVVLLSAALAMGTVRRNRDYQSAITLAQTVIERYPHARAHTWLGEGLIIEGRREEGIAQLREATAGDAKAHLGLGLTLFEDGRLDEAVDQLQQFVRKEPLLLEVISARQTIGAAFLKQGKLGDAEAEFRELVRMRPADADAHGLLAEALFKQGKFEEAIGHYQQQLKAKPNLVDVLTNLGISSIAIGRVDEAIRHFRRAAELDPGNGGAERNLARALLEKRDYNEAAVHAERAIDLAADDPVAHDELGLALAGQGKLDEAIVEFRRSLQLDPNDAEVRDHLAAALRARAGSSPVKP